MNGMNFKPFIHKVINSLSDEEAKDFYDLINSHSNNFAKRSLIKGDITDDDKGVGLYTIQLDKDTIRTGYLIYNTQFCVLLSYVSNSERIVEFELDLDTQTYEVIKEYLTTDYLRHEVAIKAVEIGELGDLVEIKEVTSLPAEGEEDTIYLSDSNVESSGEPVIIPEPLVADEGKVLKVGSNGYELGNIESGTKLYKHVLGGMAPMLFDGGNVLISTFSNPITSFSSLQTVISNGIILIANTNRIILAVFDAIAEEKYYGYYIIQTDNQSPTISTSSVPYAYFTITDTVTEL